MFDLSFQLQPERPFISDAMAVYLYIQADDPTVFCSEGRDSPCLSCAAKVQACSTVDKLIDQQVTKEPPRLQQVPEILHYYTHFPGTIIKSSWSLFEVPFWKKSRF
jgi:hypothetical protein